MTRPVDDSPVPIRRRKLMPPPLTGSLVARPRLLAKLDLGLEMPLTLVIAPAGYGKTTLVRQWAERLPVPVAWLTLDPGDADGRRFITHLVTAIADVASFNASHVLDGFRASRAAPMADIGATLADNLFDCTEALVVVLDDCHAAATGDVLTFLTHFLPMIPPEVHVVLVSRADIPLALARSRAQGQVNDLRAADLRFSQDEIDALIAMFAPAAARPDLAGLLHGQTDGWITGLRLAVQALALAKDPYQWAQSNDEHRHLMQYLVEEVLANEAPEIKDFLLRLAIVDRVSAPLADALVDDAPPGWSQAILDRLVQENLFLEPAGDDPSWYRFHPLFRQLLRHQLVMRFSPNEVSTLHRRAGHWFAQAAYIDDAISQFLAAGNPATAASLVEENLQRMLAREDWRTVAAWLRLLPDDLVHARPGLLLARAWVAHLSGRAIPLRALLAEAEALAIDQMADATDLEAVRAEIDTLSLSTLMPIEQDPQASLAVVKRARARLSPGSRFAKGLANGYVGLSLQSLGQEREAIRFLEDFAAAGAEQIDAGSIRGLLGLVFTHRQAGNLRQCADVARHMLTLAERAGLAVTVGWAHVFLGWLAYERDDLETARAHFAAVVDDARRVHLSALREAMFGQALLLHAEGNPAAADAAIERLIEVIVDSAALEHLESVHGFEARLAIMRGDLDATANWMATADVSPNSNVLHAFEHALLTRARAGLAMGTPESLATAHADVQALRERAERAHFHGRLVEILAVAALVHEARGAPDEAMAAMRQSLALAERGDVYRTFVDLGPAIVPLLRRAAAHSELPARLQGLIAAPAFREQPASPAPAPNQSLLMLLTPREGDVLDRLGRRLSYQEIADELFISPGTVKRHVGSIYSKLDAGNRREALARAAALGWTPSA